jgi:hypothetical protein
VGSSEEGYNFKDVGVDGRTVLKWFLKKQDVTAWIGFFWVRIGASGLPL